LSALFTGAAAPQTHLRRRHRVAATELVQQFLPIGWRMNAIGGNRRAALLTGIPVQQLIIGSFGMSALLSGLGGVIIASRLGSAQPELGPSFPMPAFASAFFGATTIRPGRYNALGTAVAVYAVAVIVAGLQQLGVAILGREYRLRRRARGRGGPVATPDTNARRGRAPRSTARAQGEPTVRRVRAACARN
jgi:ribose transport system permease protein